MGFEKSQAEAAIKAARGQIDLAVDFLYNGIPEGVNDNDNDQFMEGGNEPQMEGEGVKMILLNLRIYYRIFNKLIRIYLV